MSVAVGVIRVFPLVAGLRDILSSISCAELKFFRKLILCQYDALGRNNVGSCTLDAIPKMNGVKLHHYRKIPTSRAKRAREMGHPLSLHDMRPWAPRASSKFKIPTSSAKSAPEMEHPWLPSTSSRNAVEFRGEAISS